MPMQKFSTLFYCFNHFQDDMNYSTIHQFENNVEPEILNNMGPSEESIKNILNFARSYEALETQSAGYVEMILN
jgi:hypothetical protein